MRKKSAILFIVMLIFTLLMACDDPIPPTPEPTPVVTAAPTAAPTPEPTPEPTAVPLEEKGAIGIKPSFLTVSLGDSFQTTVALNTGDVNVAAYGVIINYDSSLISVKTVTAGSEGFITAFNTTEAGKVVISGFDVTGKSGAPFDICAISWTASGKGTGTISLSVDSLTDSSYNSYVDEDLIFDGVVTIQ